jgi:3-deoxy-7-phosphoheptulonate synthase
MMIVMKPTATEEEIAHVVARVQSVGARAHVSTGDEVTVIGAIGDREHVARLELDGAPGVAQVVPILKPYKLSSSQLRGGERSVFEIGGRKIGGEHFALIAGPCTVESREQLFETARAVKPRCYGAAPTSRVPRPTPSRALARPGCGCSPRPSWRPACRSSPS